jgi:hypothetical protein
MPWLSLLECYRGDRTWLFRIVSDSQETRSSVENVYSILFGGTTYFALRHIFGSSTPPSPGKDSMVSGKMRRWFGREKYAEQI